MNAQRAILILKIAIAALVIYWLQHSGYLNFRDVINAAQPWWILLAAMIMIVEVLMAALRWQIILRGMAIQLSFLESLKLIWIAQFCGTFLPGIVGGDAIRIIYVVQRFQESRWRSSLSVILDRALGLIALLFLCCLSFFFMPEKIDSAFQWVYIIPVIGVAVLGALVLALAAFAARIWEYPAFGKVMPARLKSLLIDLRSNRNFINALTMNMGLAIAAHIGVVVIFQFLIQGLVGSEIVVPFAYLCFAVPIALVAMSLPIAPSGIGVGQLVVVLIFGLLAVPSKTLGANVTSAFQLIGIAVNLIGVIPFLMHRRSTLSGMPLQMDAKPIGFSP